MHEAAFTLKLAVSQIESAIQESGDSVEGLSSSLLSMGNEVAALEDICAGSVADDAEGLRSGLSASSREMMRKIRAAVVAMQFYDRLTQRLRHVSEGLDGAAQLVEACECRLEPTAWKALRKKIRAGYTTDEERRLFDLLITDGQTTIEQSGLTGPAEVRTARR